MKHEWVHCCDEAANHQLPIAADFWIISIVSAEECSSLMQNLMQIHCSTRSGILSMVATQYTGSLNGISHPHWPVQWSHHCSHMLIPVHSPWLPGYINVMQIVLVILAMAGLFLDRPGKVSSPWSDPCELKSLMWNSCESPGPEETSDIKKLAVRRVKLTYVCSVCWVERSRMSSFANSPCLNTHY